MQHVLYHVFFREDKHADKNKLHYEQTFSELIWILP